jgi:hypothetical protein
MKSRPVNFASLLDQIETFKPLKQAAEDIGASYSHLMNIKNGARGEPSYSLGVRIIKYHQATIKGKFESLKARIKNGWQVSMKKFSGDDYKSVILAAIESRDQLIESRRALQIEQDDTKAAIVEADLQATYVGAERAHPSQCGINGFARVLRNGSRIARLGFDFYQHRRVRLGRGFLGPGCHAYGERCECERCCEPARPDPPGG